MTASKLGSILGTAGVVGGVFYGMKKSSGFGSIAFYAMLLGVSGVFIGNHLSNYYEK